MRTVLASIAIGLDSKQLHDSRTLAPSRRAVLGRECEHRYTTDPTLPRVILKVRDGLGEGYWWVECGACATSWAVPHYARESVGDDEPAAALPFESSLGGGGKS